MKKVKAVITGSPHPEAMAAVEMHESEMSGESPANNLRACQQGLRRPRCCPVSGRSKYIPGQLSQQHLSSLSVTLALSATHTSVISNGVNTSWRFTCCNWDEGWEGVDDDGIDFDEEPARTGPFRPAPPLKDRERRRVGPSIQIEMVD